MGAAKANGRRDTEALKMQKNKKPAPVLVLWGEREEEKKKKKTLCIYYFLFKSPPIDNRVSGTLSSTGSCLGNAVVKSTGMGVFVFLVSAGDFGDFGDFGAVWIADAWLPLGRLSCGSLMGGSCESAEPWPACGGVRTMECMPGPGTGPGGTVAPPYMYGACADIV